MQLWRTLSNKLARGAAFWRVASLVLRAEIARVSRRVSRPRTGNSGFDERFFHDASEAMSTSDWSWLKLIFEQRPNFANEHDPFSGAPWFHLAVDLGTPEVVDHMLAKGASIDMVDDRGLSPLFHAILREDDYTLEVIGLLLRAGADVKAVNGYGETPMDVAASLGLEHITGHLLESVESTKTPLATVPLNTSYSALPK